MNSNKIEYLRKYIDDESKFEDAVWRMKNNEPVQYIIGNVNFHGLIFDVDKRVLIPRFETEELVEKTIGYIKKHFKEPVNILDVGTGSGCIAITLKLKTNSNVDAVDISECALEVAIDNAKKLNADVKIFKSNMLESVDSKYDVIISNPPYISFDEEIMDIVKNNEPHIALYAECNGLKYYEDILSNAKKNLKEKNLIAFEIGDSQGKKVATIIEKYFPNSKISIEKDLQNRDRFIFVFNEIDN